MPDLLECASMTSLVTRCPACTTLFKVVPDQLRISEGWVRCGQCDEVFDAQAHMQPSSAHGLQPDASMARPQESSSELSAGAGDLASQGADAPALPDTLAAIDSALPFSEADSIAPLAEPAVQLEAVQTDGAHAEAVAVGSDALPWEVDGAAQVAAPDAGLDRPPLHEAVSAQTPRFEQTPPEVDDITSDFQPSFLQASAPQASSRKRRGLQAALVASLGVLLLGQVVVQQRDRIAATEPALVPPLQLLCQVLGCQVDPLRQIESIVIESSSFVKVKADVYRLSFSIKNTALVPLALPSAELALTDLRDQTMLRRVLTPAEYGARAQTLGPGEEQSLVVAVAVKATAQLSDKVTGYRLLVFYP